MAEIFFCPNCMANIEDACDVCPVCGGSMNAANEPHQLPVNSILNGRYIIGRTLGAGGFGITYVGYDLKLNSKVAVKEYYMSGGVTRGRSPSSRQIRPMKRLSARARSAFLTRPRYLHSL